MQSTDIFTKLVGRPLPIRARYFTTKSNLPRLRYVSLFTAALVFAGISVTGGKSLLAKNSFDISDQAVEDSLTYDDAHKGAGLDTSAQIAELVSPQITTTAPSREIKMAHKAIKNALQNTISEKVSALGSNTIEKLKEVAEQNIAATEKPADPQRISVTLRKGDTLTGLLRKQGVGASEAYRAVNALSKLYDPRRMKPGLIVDLKFGEDRVVDGDTYKTIELLDVPYDEIKSARLTVNDDGKFAAKRHEKEIVYTEKTGAFNVELSLFGSAEKAGIPHSIVAEAMRIYAWNVDFQRDLRKGDRLEVLYREAKIKETGKETGKKDILHARLTLSDRDLPIYRMELKDGRVDYFQEDGRSIRKALMRTPINGGRISSGYGMRKHPILGYNKMHKGMDFAAPTGTKIYAAGDGVIDYVGTRGAYGKYIRIRHNSNLKTAYAHLHRYEKGIYKGKRVKQGEVIGRVGSTGRSTGPHLHYEVLVDGRQVNPRSVKLPTGEKLKGETLQAFKKQMKRYDARYAMLSEQIKVADASNIKNGKRALNE